MPYLHEIKPSVQIERIKNALQENWNDPEFEAIQKKLKYRDFEVLAEFINNVILPEYESRT